MNKKDLAAMMDHTLLKATATPDQIKKSVRKQKRLAQHLYV